MINELAKIINIYATKSHKELNTLLLDKSKDGLIALFNNYVKQAEKRLINYEKEKDILQKELEKHIVQKTFKERKIRGENTGKFRNNAKIQPVLFDDKFNYQSLFEKISVSS